MTTIRIDIPEGFLDDVPEELHIERDDDLKDALREGHSMRDAALSVMRDEAGKSEREPLFGRLTRAYRYLSGNETELGKEARKQGLRSEHMGYADDPVALRARDKAAWQRTCLEQENLLVRVAENGGDYRSLLKLRPTNERLASTVEKRLAERALKQAG